MLKKVILSAAAYLLHFSLGHADVDISKYALGMSNKSLHNQLVEDGFTSSISIQRRGEKSQIILRNRL